MSKSIQITLLPTDEAFAENLRELREIQPNVEFVSVVRNGTAQEARFVPYILPPGDWFEYDGWRCKLAEIERVIVYLSIERPS